MMTNTGECQKNSQKNGTGAFKFVIVTVNGILFFG